MSQIGFSSQDDDYKNFHLKQIKLLKSYEAENDVLNLLPLKDGRILICITKSEEDDEKGKRKSMLCIFSSENGFSCDFKKELDIGSVECFEMSDGNVLINYKTNHYEIVKIKKDSIEVISSIKDQLKNIEELLFDNFLMRYTNKDKKIKFRWIYKIYSYNHEMLVMMKDLSELMHKEDTKYICFINKNEFAISTSKKNFFTGEKFYLKFYDINSDKLIKSITIDKASEKASEMFLANKSNLLVDKGYSLYAVVDINSKSVISEIKFPCPNLVFTRLNEKLLLVDGDGPLFLYELEASNNYKLKEQRGGIKFNMIFKYPGNKLIAYEDNIISIYG